MEEIKNLLLSIEKSVEYNTKLLESIFEAVDERKNTAKNSMDHMEMVKKLMLNHPSVTQNPGMADMIKQMLNIMPNHKENPPATSPDAPIAVKNIKKRVLDRCEKNGHKMLPYFTDSLELSENVLKSYCKKCGRPIIIRNGKLFLNNAYDKECDPRNRYNATRDAWIKEIGEKTYV